MTAQSLRTRSEAPTLSCRCTDCGTSFRSTHDRDECPAANARTTLTRNRTSRMGCLGTNDMNDKKGPATRRLVLDDGIDRLVETNAQAGAPQRFGRVGQPTAGTSKLALANSNDGT